MIGFFKHREVIIRSFLIHYQPLLSNFLCNLCNHDTTAVPTETDIVLLKDRRRYRNIGVVQTNVPLGVPVE